MTAMSLTLSTSSLFRSSHVSSSSASNNSGLPRATTAKIASVSPSDEWFEERKGRISKVFDKNEVSISTYDTAWVAMVPSPFSSGEPCFPDSLYWLLENQCHDGSWARPHHHSLLKKDVLSSTLACILALKKWGVGQQHINKGLDFLEVNFGSARDETQMSPMGFEILFPAMLDLARGLSLNFSLDQTTLNDLMNMRDLELKRCCESESRDMEAYLAYIGEGMGKTLQEWESVVKKYQRKNGSLFNSPSTTCAAFIALGNTDCLKYLHLLVNTFGSAVPAVYPVDIYSQLCTVDKLERLGISRFFMKEIQRVLDQTYRCWVQGDEDIFMDASTCALAFRILRMNGYSVTSDPILHPSCVHGHTINVTTTLELYRASQLALYPHETQLEEQKLRLRSKLEQELSSGSIQSPQLNAEVKQALDYPFYTIIDRMAKRKAIENYNFDNTRILKTSYCLANLGNKDFLHLSVEDYNQCQAIHREESREFDRWLVESRLNEVESARHRSASIAYCYSTAAAAVFGPQVSDARMAWAKNSVLITFIDDLFDVHGSVEDMRKLIHMVELWDVDVSTECCSHDVGILFSALKSSICEIADKGSKLHGRWIKSHMIAIWLDMLYACMKEVEWRENKYVPTWDEYMTTALVSFASGPNVLPLLYVVGPKISQEMVNHSDYHNLYKLVSTIGRLLNDIRGYERERKEGKVSAVPLYIAKNGGEMSAEAAISEIVSVIDSQTKELLRLVLEKKESSSALPRSCKELFWNMSSVLHLFYNKVDGYRSREFLQVLDHNIHQPIVIEEFKQPSNLTTAYQY